MTAPNSAWAKEPAPRYPAPTFKGSKIEGFRYHSKEFFEKEWEYMWTKVWLLLGRADDIPETGDYQQEEVGPESILMVRQEDGSIKAFYNVCQHRGARLIFNDLGTVDAFTCPYHGWRWEIDGQLTFALDPEDFPEGDPCGKLKLEPIRCEVFAGFIWVNMDPDCVPLKEYLGPLWDEWSAYELDHWKRYLAQTCTAPINWKVILDNFNESYHLPTVHPQAAGKTEESYLSTQYDMAPEGHARMWMQSGKPSKQMEWNGGQVKIEPVLERQLRLWELDPDEFRGGREYETREAIQQAMRKLGKSRGYNHFDNLRDHQLTDVYHYFLFPNFAVSLWATGFHFLRARPHPTDPTQSVFDHWWYSPVPIDLETPIYTPNGVFKAGDDVEHEVFNYGEQSLGMLIDQDMGVTTGQQLGFRSRAYTGVYLSGQEARIRRYHEVIDEYIEGKGKRKINANPHTAIAAE